MNPLHTAVREVFQHPSTMPRKFRTAFKTGWEHFWVPCASLSPFGRIAARLATWFAPPYTGRVYLADLHRRGFISASAVIHHQDIRLGPHIFIADGVTIFQSMHAGRGGPVEIRAHACLWGNNLLETGGGGGITIGEATRINRGVQLVSYVAPIHIGRDVGIGQNTALYSFNHTNEPGTPYSQQPLRSRGPIIVGDYAWIGLGSIVLSGVRIGTGAVIGAGSVVTHDVPDWAVAVGNPARIVREWEAAAVRDETAAVTATFTGNGNATAGAD